jgi:hypothetical protein
MAGAEGEGADNDEGDAVVLSTKHRFDMATSAIGRAELGPAVIVAFQEVFAESEEGPTEEQLGRLLKQMRGRLAGATYDAVRALITKKAGGDWHQVYECLLAVDAMGES